MTPDEPPALGSLSVVLIPEPDPVVTGRQCASGEPLSCEPWLSPWHFLAALPSQGWCGLEVRPGRAACCAAGPGRSPCLPFLVRLLCRERQRLHFPVPVAGGPASDADCSCPAGASRQGSRLRAAGVRGSLQRGHGVRTSSPSFGFQGLGPRGSVLQSAADAVCFRGMCFSEV